MTNNACPNCGSTAIHACMGFKPKPMTQAEMDRLKVAIAKISGKETK